jgi:peptidoglycan/LPS O-acetylase OafA/YrhL
MDQTLRPAQVRPRRRRPRGELPALDGLRAVAVLAVMFYHFGLGGFRGGFLGVDVFFVLSGYLITGQLFTRWVLDSGVSLPAFWLARARRLLPGLGALLLGTTTAVLLLDRSQIGLFRGDLTAAATYSSNWWYVFHSRSYFVAAGRPPLLQHLWSLAVEEQFYLVWPLVIALVIAKCRSVEGRRRILIALALGIAAASSLVMGIGSAIGHAPQAGDPSRWYFGSDSHVMGLLLGAALALLRRGDNLGASHVVPRARATTYDTVAGTAALVVLLYLLSQTDQFSVWLYRWGFTVVSLLAAVVIACATRPGPLASVLSPPILRGIGRRSYALYLWHWPVACFTRPGIDLPIPGTVAFMLRMALTFLLACASYRWIELPVRQQGWRTFWRSVAGASIGIVRVPTILTAFVTALVTAMMMPATASPAERALAGGGTVYVSDPGHPGGVRVSRSIGDGSRGPQHAQHPSGSVIHLPGIQQPSAPPPKPQPHPRSQPAATDPPPGLPHHISQLRHYDLVVYGDSVALGAIPDLAAMFHSVTNNATEGIQAYSLLPQITATAAAGRLDSDIVLIHTGDNGIIERSQLETALRALHNTRRVIVAVPYVPRDWQSDNVATVEAVASRFSNVQLMPWETIARAHPEYLWTDHIHLTPTGEHAYANLVAHSATVQ